MQIVGASMQKRVRPAKALTKVLAIRSRPAVMVSRARRLMKLISLEPAVRAYWVQPEQ